MIKYTKAPGSGSGSGIESVTGYPVDLTDPANPVVSLGFNMYLLNITQSGTNDPVVNDFYQNYRSSPPSAPVFSRVDVGVYDATWGSWVLGSFLVNFGVIISGPNFQYVSAAPSTSTTFTIRTFIDINLGTPSDGVMYGTTFLIFSPSEYII